MCQHSALTHTRQLACEKLLLIRGEHDKIATNDVIEAFRDAAPASVPVRVCTVKGQPHAAQFNEPSQTHRILLEHVLT